MNDGIIFLYGPPGAGKSTIGRLLAQALDLPFFDLDAEIEQQGGRSIPQIFAAEGEDGFRAREQAALEQVMQNGRSVVALGGGALLRPANRALAEASGQVLLFTAPPEVLAERLQSGVVDRPLLAGDPQRLISLLAERQSHYASFNTHMDTTSFPPAGAAWEAQIRLGVYRVRGMANAANRAGQEAYDVCVQPGSLDGVGNSLRARGLRGPVMLVSDDQVGPLYAGRVLASLRAAGYEAHSTTLRSGEEHKTLTAVASLWQAFLAAGLERRSTALALGGGVVTDLTGFAASTYLRGMRWAAQPTSLLGMADASLGGKTGADLPQGKNLIGAFHAPALVLADPETLATLPEAELRSGLGEVVKHGILSDAVLLNLCRALDGRHLAAAALTPIVQRAVAVKVRVIEQDPFEQGARAALNLGHTIGHAVELASGFQLRHGEAVAIGMVVEARLAEEIGLAEPGLADQIAAILSELGLPTRIPARLSPQVILQALNLDKKKDAGAVRFALPIRMGHARTGILIEQERIRHALDTAAARA